MTISFVNLHVHTENSILDSLISIKDLFPKIKELGQKAVAITDHSSLAAAWESLKASRATGIKLIIGCESYFQENPEDKLSHLTLIAKNAIGYKNLLILNKMGFDNSPVQSKRVYSVLNWDLLSKYSEGIICLTGCGSGLINQLLMSKLFDKVNEAILKLKNIFGDNLGLEVHPNNMKRNASSFCNEIDQIFLNRKLISLGGQHNIRVVPTCNSHYLNKSDSEVHDALLCVGVHMPIYSSYRLKYNVPDFYIKSAEEVFSFFERNYGSELAKQLCDNTIYFANMCEKPDWINPMFSNPSGKELPDFPVKDELDYNEFLNWKSFQSEERQLLDEDKLYLRYKCEIGLKAKNLQDKQEYLDRLEKELDVLYFCGTSSYMLIVADYINWCKKNGVSVGPGRGCLTKDTLVLTEKGFKNLDKIKVGDKVYSHTGSLQNVLNRFEYNINEKLLKIKTAYSLYNIVMTKDHKVFGSKSILTDRYVHFLKNSYKYNKIKKYEPHSAPEWLAISDLNINDNIYMTFPKKNINKNNIPKSFTISYSTTKNSKRDNIATINVDNDFIYLLGRFTGDGWIRESEVRRSYEIGIAFNRKDQDSINWFINYFNSFGFHIDIQEHKTKSLTQLIIHNKDLMEVFKKIFCDYEKTSATKHFPYFFRDLTDEQLKYLLNGLIDSDGHRSNRKYDNRINIDSTSYRLICEVKELLLYLKIPSSINDRQEYYKDSYLCKKSYKLRFESSYLKDNYINNDNGYYAKILNIEEVDGDKVYDITVENDNSYLTTNYAVHNSGAGALTGYLLDIHCADPIKYGLLFERFYSKLRTSLADIDVDFSKINRYKVIQYIQRKYGEDNVAQISNLIEITPKVFARDISRCCELGGSRESAVKVGNEVADSISSDIKNISSAFEKSPLFAEYCKKYPEFLKYKDISNKYRSFGIHASGVIISKRPLVGLIPVRKDKNGVMSIEYDKDVAEENGLVKMDILGLSTLDIIDSINQLIVKNGKEAPKINYDEYDEKTYDLIVSGITFGIFQFGTSAGTIDLCKKIKPKNIEDLAIITTLARPASKEIREQFIKTRDKNEMAPLLHPALEKALKPTFGYPLYDESLLQLASDISNWDLAEADKLRKLTKEKGKNPEKAKKWKQEFINGAIKNNINEIVATRIWEDIVEPFGRYSFNKSLYQYQDINVYTCNGDFLQTKPIKDVNIGDFVKSRDEETKKDIFIKVNGIHDHGKLPLVQVKLTSGEKIKCTMNHKFRVKENGEMLPLWKIVKEKLSIVVDTVS